jgi:hypothetical protein
MSFLYYSPISINSAQVPTTQTDFPMLVSVTDTRFKTVINGGHVQNASGFDIRPYSDSGLTSAITGYELERYNAITGEIVMWVKVASLSSSTTPIYLAYGDSSISTDGSSATTWSNSFNSVYHLKDGTTLSVSDSTGNHNGTNHSATAATGQIDGGGGFVSASSQYIDCGFVWHIGGANATISAWVKATSFPNAYNGPFGWNNGTDQFVLLIKSTGKLGVFYANGGGGVNYDGTGTNTLSTGTWYYLTATTGTGLPLIGYVNASVDKTVGTSNALRSADVTFAIGQDSGAGSRFWNGAIDEVRVSTVARSADWISTEYNSQSAPGTFATLGSEVGAIFSGLFTM